MNYNVVISDQAKKDLYRIYSYISTVLKSKVSANSILKRLYEAIEKLNFMPNISPVAKGTMVFTRSKVLFCK